MADLKRFVGPPIEDSRVPRLWPGVAERLERRRPRRIQLWATVLVSVAALAITALLTRPLQKPPSSASVSETRLETAANPIAVTLADGSRIKLSERTRVEFRDADAHAVKLSLESGEIACDVTHRPERSFVVKAGDVEVRVVGTHFSVKAKTRAGETMRRVEVSVTRGAVEVRTAKRPGEVVHLGPGQSWTEQAGVAVPPERTPEIAKREAPRAAPSAPPAATNPPGPREIFERATERRRQGDAAGAAEAYDEFLQRFPNDGRAGLAAFELGRLRLDRLGDPAGAARALERALSKGNGASFREDALARLMEAHVRLGDFNACERARERYLASYPDGLHVASKAMKCGGR